MTRTLMGVGAMTVVAGLLAFAPVAEAQGGGQRRAPDPRSMGGGDCRDNPLNCKDTPNPLPKADTVWLEEMTWMDVRDAMAAGKTTVIIPTGGHEPNGPWLALGKHNYVLTANCDAIARKMGNALCAPVIKHVPEGGIDPPTGHMTSPGTISLREDTFRALLTDTAESLVAHGFKQVFFIGDSGGNQAGQRAVAEALNAKHAGKALVAHIQEYYDYARSRSTWPPVRAEGDQVREHARRPDHHPEHVHRRSGLGALRRAREGGQGHHQRRGRVEPAKNTEWAKQIVAFRADKTIEAINKAIANKGTLPAPPRQRPGGE
jgi:creatinine amidohydrolase